MTVFCSSASNPDPPLGRKLVGNSYDIRTAAECSGNIMISLPFDNSTMTADDLRLLKLMEWSQNTLARIDVTTSVGTRTPYFTKLNVVNGATSSLSLFSVMWKLAGDVNGDFTVDIYDAILPAGAFNS